MPLPSTSRHRTTEFEFVTTSTCKTVPTPLLQRPDLPRHLYDGPLVEPRTSVLKSVVRARVGKGVGMPRFTRRERNREMFRQVNENIALLDRLRGDDATLSLICECHRLGCADVVEAPAATYAAVKGEGLFLVRRGHEDPDQEAVVADHGDFLIVRDDGG